VVTSELDYDSVQAEIQERYQSGDYVMALALAERYQNHFQDRVALFTYWLICFNARLRELDRSILLLRNALISGLWYGEVLLRKSPSLQPLQGIPDYENLVILNRQVQDADQTYQYPLIILRSEEQCSHGSPPCPLLLGLHRNTGTVQSSLSFWRGAAYSGWLVAAPQSTQAAWKDAYIWDNLDITRDEILHHTQTVINGYSIDPSRIVLGGHSMGGEVAIWLALSGAIPAAGFLAFGPGGPMMDHPDQWQPYIEAAASRATSRHSGSTRMDEGDTLLRGYLIYGEEDRSIQPQNIQLLADALEASGLPCQVESVPGVGHDFDPKFETALMRALSFISPHE
jgi:predicted esterase